MKNFFLIIIITFCPFQLCSLALAKVDFSHVPGVVIDHQAASTKNYIGSPSIARLPDGAYVASHDLFGPGPLNARTRIFSSTNKGRSWKQIATIKNQFWGTIFVHKKDLYLIGTSGQNGHCIIRRSTDNGHTWTEPTDKTNGLLIADGKYHCAPQPIVIHNGRLWRGMEDAMGPDGWGEHFHSFMMSIPVDADLLKAENWTLSERIGYNGKWLDGKFGGFLEGNAVATPNGDIVNILRVDYKPEGGKAAMIHISDDGQRATFDPQTDFIDFPGGCKKFTIRKDPHSEYYWTLTNWV
ncbi:exo-alpha-sialidase, partial [bacterium]|nr:exo-alpha-sialidase [bacterium]